MIPATLSASAIKTFEDCEAGFKAQYIDKIRQGSGVAAGLGTAVHESLEYATTTLAGEENDPAFLDKVLAYFEQKSIEHALPPDMVTDGGTMITNWVSRYRENPPHAILSSEIKESFPITVKVNGKKYKFTFNYIIDRVDQLDDGSIEGIDYKTWRKNYDGGDMTQVIQVRSYAVALAIKYKDQAPPAIWITYDQLRYGPTSIKFTKAAISATWNYLKEVITRIVESDGTRETINENCRYCPRKAECVTLNAAIATGNIQRVMQDPERAALKLAEMKEAMKAAGDTISELESYLGDVMEQEELPILQYEVDGRPVKVQINVTTTRKPQMERISRVLGPEIMHRYHGRMNLSDIDALLASGELTEKQEREVRSFIINSPSTKVSATFPKR